MQERPMPHGDSRSCRTIAKSEITHRQNLPIAMQDISFKDGFG
jgi:hypothetical protein